MGSLSNLYISQSYTSLAHLGTNNALVPGTMTQLQDGLGQSLNINFDGTNISSSGNIFAANITASVVNTGSLVTTSSFNAYTSSTNVRLNSIETTTASLNNSVALLNTNSASVNVSITNLNASSASQQVSINALNQFTASQSTASIVNSINALNTFSASTLVSLSNLNTTTASLNNSVSLLNTNSASVNISVSNLNTATASLNSATASLFTSTSLSLITASFDNGTRNLTFTKGNNETFSVNIPDASGSILPPGVVSGSSQINIYDTTGFATFNDAIQFDISQKLFTSSFNVYTSSTNIRLDNLEAATSSYAISSSVAAVDAAQQQQINSLIAFTSSVTSSTTIQSNGTTLGQASTLNFLGTGVNVSVGALTASITINAGSGSGGGTAGNSYTSTFTGTTWVVNHNLNTSVPLVFAYESGSQWVIPASLDVTSPNSVTLQFSQLVSGSVVVVNGGDQTVIETITNATTAVLTHNLNTEWPIVQVYESGSRAQIIPSSIVSDTASQITIGFSTPVSGKVVIKK